MRTRTRALARALAVSATRAASTLPGLGAAGCALTGVWLLAGLAWTLLAAAALLLALDWRLR